MLSWALHKLFQQLVSNRYFKHLPLSFNLQLPKDDLAISSKRKLKPFSFSSCLSPYLPSQWRGYSSLCPKRLDCTFHFCFISRAAFSEALLCQLHPCYLVSSLSLLLPIYPQPVNRLKLLPLVSLSLSLFFQS